jgi:hypothetical protein
VGESDSGTRFERIRESDLIDGGDVRSIADAGRVGGPLLLFPGGKGAPDLPGEAV